jgi:hypothetical protein
LEDLKASAAKDKEALEKKVSRSFETPNPELSFHHLSVLIDIHRLQVAKIKASKAKAIKVQPASLRRSPFESQIFLH